ncbi:MAG: hypothetical protein KDH15_20855 [Rhodocyclaceae bacterium]|nr:hypothetical protein [Rhodocyclaceae bacterium]
MLPSAPIPLRIGAAALLLGTILVSAGCVTINIYFPAAAAEKAADRIIEGVWQLPKGQGAQAPADGDTR